MPTYIRKRVDGPTWIKNIFIEDAGKHINGILEGDNMHNIKIYSVSPTHQKGDVISEGRLRVIKSYDQGNVASYLVYQPNKRKYPRQEKIIIMRVV